MWTLTDGVTNVATVPADGIINLKMPWGVKVSAFVNGHDAALHHLHVKAGDTVSFKVKNKNPTDDVVVIDYAGDTSKLMVPGMVPIKEDKMDTSNLFAVPAMGSGMGGAIGGGLGAGLLGGVLGGALLGNNGGLFGNNKGVTDPLAAVTAQIQANSALTDARFNAAAQADILKTIEAANAAQLLALATGNAALGVEIAKGQGEINTQAALNAAALGVQNAKGFGDISTQVALTNASLGVQIEKTAAANALAVTMGQKDIQAQAAALAQAASMQAAENKYALATAISTDGQLTRALIVAQNDAELNRRLVNAQNEIIELRGDRRLTEVGGNITISNNNNAVANAQQQQAQLQQQQIALLANNVAALVQQNQHIQQGILNIGSGVVAGNAQTAANTRVN